MNVVIALDVVGIVLGGHRFLSRRLTGRSVSTPATPATTTASLRVSAFQQSEKFLIDFLLFTTTFGSGNVSCSQRETVGSRLCRPSTCSRDLVTHLVDAPAVPGTAVKLERLEAAVLVALGHVGA
jgi:hypothetical protein